MSTLDNVPKEIPVHHVSALESNDPFATDGEEYSITELSSYAEAMKEEIAQNREHLGWTQVEDLQAHLFEEQNASVSTLDINGNNSLDRSQSVSPQGDDSVPSTEFSQISLSNGDGDHDGSSPFHEHEQSNSPYPSIVIDASDSATHQVILTTDSTSAKTPSPPPASHAFSTHSLPPESVQPFQRTSDEQAPSSSTSNLPPLSNVARQTYPTQETPQKSSQLTEKRPSHRLSQSTGPSMFEKVRSKTRPTFLPPKPKAEDEKHLADWQKMMKLSRAAAEKQRKAFQERRLLREQNIEASLQLWEKELVPDWRVVHKNPRLRKLWWQGIPSKLRATMWEKAVGNPLALSKDHFRSCLSRAKRALESNIFPQATLDLIEQDILSTLPALHIFHPVTGPMYTDLKELLYAWVVARSDEGLGYTFGAAKIAGMTLITMPSQQAFNVMRNLLERHCLRSFYGGERAREDVEAYYRIFDTLLADGMPKIYFNFKQHQISPAAYLSDWFITLFLDHLPFEACARVWDVIMLEGDSFLYRAALGILAVLESRLFFPERKELLELLRGENKAALEVAKREGQRLDGGKYEIYGVDEETLWERIDAMEDWWKESTWTRLIQRELPDL